MRLHYVYPYPHVRELIPLMADGIILPYLDIPFQHAHPAVLKRMARPAASVSFRRNKKWRSICPEITLRSTFIVGYPGETEDEFNTLIIGLMKLNRIAWDALNMKMLKVPDLMP